MGILEKEYTDLVYKELFREAPVVGTRTYVNE